MTLPESITNGAKPESAQAETAAGGNDYDFGIKVASWKSSRYGTKSGVIWAVSVIAVPVTAEKLCRKRVFIAM